MELEAKARSVLVVEDDEDLRDVLRQILEDEGYLVALASDGRQALEMLNTIARPCLALVDFLMPVMDGKAFIDALSQDDRFATLPVVLLSGWPSDPNVRPSVRLLKKPVDLSLLLEIVHAHCRTTTSPSIPATSFACSAPKT